MGDLAEWIRVNRAQDVVALDEDLVRAPVAAPAAPEAPNGGTFDPVGTLLPTPLQLSQVGAPLLVLLVSCYLVGGLAAGGIAAVTSTRRRR